LTWSETSSKSARPAKDFESCETVSIAEARSVPSFDAQHNSLTTNQHDGSSLICGLPAKPRGVILSPMKLRLVVEHDPQTKRWAAFFPELPGCASAGDTEEEAVRNAKEALDLWFEPAPVTFPAGAKVLEVALG
jgi:predicted RNase H-like HicB family nuclease